MVSLRWQSGGFDAQGWLVPPAQVEPGRTYPMVTAVHGGPSWAVPAHFTQEAAIYSSAGLVIYEGEGHVFRKPQNKRDRSERLLGWFDQHLAPRAK